MFVFRGIFYLGYYFPVYQNNKKKKRRDRLKNNHNKNSDRQAIDKAGN